MSLVECFHPWPLIMSKYCAAPEGISQPEAGSESASDTGGFLSCLHNEPVSQAVQLEGILNRTFHSRVVDVATVCPSWHHVLTLCTVASLLLVAQYTRLLLANEVTTEVPAAPQTCAPAFTDRPGSDSY